MPRPKVPVNRDYVDGVPNGPTVSVCVPVYNNSATIARCLRSVLDQDGVDFEIVVVDDDSSDESAAIAATMLRRGRPVNTQSASPWPQPKPQQMFGIGPWHLRPVRARRSYWLLPGALLTLARCFNDPTVGMAFAPRRVETDELAWKARYATPHVHFSKLEEHNQGRSLVTQIALRGVKDTGSANRPP